MKALLYLLTCVLLASCNLFRPTVPDLPDAPLVATEVVQAVDSTLNGENHLEVVFGMPLIPPGLNPRQQRRYLRVASRAQVRVLAAQQPAMPLVNVSKVKDKSDNRGSQGGSYAPRAKAPVAAGGSTATLTETRTPNWLWWLLVAGMVWLVWRARTPR